jgi:hypothetical protein
MFGPLKKSGHNITANGANLKLDRASGVAWATGRNYGTDPNNPSIVSDTSKTSALVHRYYSDGSTGHVLDSNNGAGFTNINPGLYDDGSGTLATVSGGLYTVQRLFYFPTTPDIIVAYYGKNTYTSIDEARRNYLLEDFTEAENTAAQAIYLGAIIVKGNATALNNTADAKILTAGIFRSLAATSLGGSAAASALSDLSDVTVSNPTNNQFLKYNSTNGLFENTSVTSDDIAEGSTNLYDQTVAIAEGNNITVTGTYPNFTIASAHPSISAATSADNSGLTFLQDLTLDSNGHVTGLVSTTITTEAIVDGGTNLATADDIHTFVTGQGYITGNQTITLTGDITGSGTTSIATTIAANSVEGSMLNNNVISGQTELTSGLDATDEILVSDAGSIKRMDIDVLQTYMQSNLSFTSNTDVDVSAANLQSRLSGLATATTIGDDLIVTGDLTVNGTTTTINTTELSVSDNQIILNDDLTGTAVDGGILLERGSSGADASLLWDESAGAWLAGLVGSENRLLTTADAGTGNGLDADTLDGQEGSYYLNYANLTSTPTIPSAANDSTITFTAGTGLSGGGTFTTDQNTNSSITIDLDFSELTDMTSDISGTTEFILQDGVTESRKAANEIKLSAFNNDSGFTTNTGTVTSVGTDTGLTGTVTSTGSIGLAINDLTVETTIADADEILFYDATASAHKTITKANLVSAISLTGGSGVTINSNAIDVDADQRSIVTHIGATTDDYYKSINTGVHEWYGSGALNMQLEDDGDLLVRQDVVAFSTVVASDKSLKDNIKTIHKGLDIVNKLRGVEFDWNYGKKEGQHDIGVVAQEVEKVIPEIVYSKKLLDDKEIKTVDYEKITAVLIEAVKELSQEVTELKKQINA